MKNEKNKPTQEEQYLKRMHGLNPERTYDGGMSIGTVPNMHNVNSKIWILFKDISLLHGNNEGAALAAVVTAWMSIPSNKALLDSIHAARKSLEEEEKRKSQ